MLSLFSPFLSISATRILWFPSLSCKINSLPTSPGVSSLSDAARCRIGENKVPVVSDVDTDESSHPHLSHPHPIACSWTEVPASGTVIIQQPQNWVTSKLNPAGASANPQMGVCHVSQGLQGGILFYRLSFVNFVTLTILETSDYAL